MHLAREESFDAAHTEVWRIALEDFDRWLALPERERPSELERIRALRPAAHACVLTLIAADAQAERGRFLLRRRFFRARHLRLDQRARRRFMLNVCHRLCLLWARHKLALTVVTTFACAITAIVLWMAVV